MSAEKGWVYCLINPSMPGICKIGVTTKHPLERTKELSAATGVATPFVLAYFKHVGYPFQVEAEIHRNLAARRVNESREFFMIPLHEAIAMVDKYDETEIENPVATLVQCTEISAMETPFALLFSTFPENDGAPRQLTETEMAQCRELEAEIGMQ